MRKNQMRNDELLDMLDDVGENNLPSKFMCYYCERMKPVSQLCYREGQEVTGWSSPQNTGFASVNVGAALSGKGLKSLRVGGARSGGRTYYKKVTRMSCMRCAEKQRLIVEGMPAGTFRLSVLFFLMFLVTPVVAFTVMLLNDRVHYLWGFSGGLLTCLWWIYDSNKDKREAQEMQDKLDAMGYE